MAKHKHLTLSDRQDIQLGLQNQKTFKNIAEIVDKDPSTISKEVRKHIVLRESTVTSSCRSHCPKLDKPPYVCNGCPFRRKDCGYTQQFYYAKKAHNQYRQELVDSREGIALNKESFYKMNDFVSKKIMDGQRLNHIIASNNLGISRATIYRYVDKGYLDVKPIDLPRKVKFKKRRKSDLPPIPKKYKIGRSYADFLEHIEKNDISSWLEMDTVVGTVGGKLLLTFNLTFCNFIFGRVIDNKSANEVVKHLQEIKKTFHLAGENFSHIFPVILTDNGGEFARVEELEADYNSNLQLFFCDPNRSNQKGKIEKNHTLVRDILPKGTSFDNLTQDDLNLVMSHINSIKRHALGNKTAYELFTFAYSEELAALLGIRAIPSDKVCQSPQLLER